MKLSFELKDKKTSNIDLQKVVSAEDYGVIFGKKHLFQLVENNGRVKLRFWEVNFSISLCSYEDFIILGLDIELELWRKAHQANGKVKSDVIFIDGINNAFYKLK